MNSDSYAGSGERPLHEFDGRQSPFVIVVFVQQCDPNCDDGSRPSSQTGSLQ
jgi:hypothetical protein